MSTKSVLYSADESPTSMERMKTLEDFIDN